MPDELPYCPRCGRNVQVMPCAEGYACLNCGQVLIAGHPEPGAAPQEVGGTHYQQGLQVSPWELQRTMKTSGNVFADARRADAIKYTWRMKGDVAKLIEDLKKARHCLDAAIEELDKTPNVGNK